MKPYSDAVKTKAYQDLRSAGFSKASEAEASLGRELTEDEMWAVLDNYNDDVMVDMGR